MCWKLTQQAVIQKLLEDILWAQSKHLVDVQLSCVQIWGQKIAMLLACNNFYHKLTEILSIGEVSGIWQRMRCWSKASISVHSIELMELAANRASNDHFS